MTNQNRLFLIQIYVTQSETRVDVRDVVKSEVEEPMMVTNQKTDAIDQSEPDGFHVENEPLVDAGQKIEKVEIKDQGEEPRRKESETNIPMDMDFTTADLMEDDLEAFEAIRNLFES